MNHNLSTVKKYLHLAEFTSIGDDDAKIREVLHLGINERIDHNFESKTVLIKETIKDNHSDRLLIKLARSLGPKVDNYELCFIGGNHKSVFFLTLSNNDSNGFPIYCPVFQDQKKTAQDMILLKEFIENQYKKVSHE